MNFAMRNHWKNDSSIVAMILYPSNDTPNRFLPPDTLNSPFPAQIAVKAGCPVTKFSLIVATTNDGY
jgi:hypothetical protein